MKCAARRCTQGAQMRTAILTDIHANLEALTACIAAAEEQKVDRFVCLGDTVGYGADPNAGPRTAGLARLRPFREALEARSDVIVMPMPTRRPSGKVLNRTLEVVLGKRPARVLVDSTPAEPLLPEKKRELVGIT